LSFLLQRLSGIALGLKDAEVSINSIVERLQRRFAGFYEQNEQYHLRYFTITDSFLVFSIIAILLMSVICAAGLYFTGEALFLVFPFFTICLIGVLWVSKQLGLKVAFGQKGREVLGPASSVATQILLGVVVILSILIFAALFG
jgi:hypothetical protein